MKDQAAADAEEKARQEEIEREAARVIVTPPPQLKELPPAVELSIQQSDGTYKPLTDISEIPAPDTEAQPQHAQPAKKGAAAGKKK